MAYRNVKNDYSEALFENPNAALDHYGEQLRQDIYSDLAPHLAHQQRDKTTTFWIRFFRQYPELNTEMGRVVANAVMAEAMNAYQLNPADPEALGNQPLVEAIAEVASLTEERMSYIKHHEAEERERAVFVGGPGDEDGSQAAERAAYGVNPRRDTLGATVKRRREQRLRHSRYSE